MDTGDEDQSTSDFYTFYLHDKLSSLVASGDGEAVNKVFFDTDFSTRYLYPNRGQYIKLIQKYAKDKPDLQARLEEISAL